MWFRRISGETVLPQGQQFARSPYLVTFQVEVDFADDYLHTLAGAEL